MAFTEYIAHLDARIRTELAAPAIVAGVRRLGETVVSWDGDGRHVRAERARGRVEFLLYVGSEALPYDRFGDDLEMPDLATTARKIVEFLSETDDDAAS